MRYMGAYNIQPAMASAAAFVFKPWVLGRDGMGWDGMDT